jgi:hypothetical protein
LNLWCTSRKRILWSLRRVRDSETWIVVYLAQLQRRPYVSSQSLWAHGEEGVDDIQRRVPRRDVQRQEPVFIPFAQRRRTMPGEEPNDHH